MADPRADAGGTTCHGYMEIRALHQQALLGALTAVPEVDAEWAEGTGRTWGGLTWEHLLDDAEVVLIAAGSLGTQLTLVAEQLRAEGVVAGVLGLRCYRPFPVEALRAKLAGRKIAIVFDKAMSYGYEGPICGDLKAALCGVSDAPVVFGTVSGLGGRDTTPADLLGAAQRAIADYSDGIRDRGADWINLQLEGGAR